MMHSSIVSPEAATPLMSNLHVSLSETQLLPSLELPGSAAASMSSQRPPSSVRIARFSSPEAAPIVMTSFEAIARETQLSRNRERQAEKTLMVSEQIGVKMLRNPNRMITGISCCPSTHKYEIQSLALCLAWDFGCLTFVYSQKMWRRFRLILIGLCNSYLHHLYLEAQARRTRNRSSLRRGHASWKTSIREFYRNQLPKRLVSVASGTTMVQGLPNFGQTCFLNAVLQCLAALDPFVEYLVNVVTILDDREPNYDEADVLDEESDIDDDEDIRQSRWRRGSQEQREPHSDTTDAGLLPYLLLGMLLSINGVEFERDLNRSRSISQRRLLDPRPILVAVGRDHEQFRSRNRFQALTSSSTTSEQQDAQELLQAMMGMVVAAADLDSVDSALPIFLASDRTMTTSLRQNRLNGDENGNYEHDDDMLTAASGAKEAKYQLFLGSVKPMNGNSDLNVFHLDDHKMEDSLSVSLDHSSDNRDGDSSSQSDCDNDGSETNEDEKKQDEFQIRIPYVSSEENLPQLETQIKSVDFAARSNETASPLSMDSIDGPFNTASCPHSDGNRMSVTSSTQNPMRLFTSSPFCGWLGSSLQCTRCKHVRPIQNAQFFDIPVIPTSVSGYLTGSSRWCGNHVGHEPVKYSPANKGPPCTLEELLQEFTDVERVSGVECRNCTLKREMENLEEEVAILKEGIHSVISKARRYTKIELESSDGDEELAKDLRRDLEFAVNKLSAFRSMNPDEDGVLENIYSRGNISDMMPQLSIERSDAFKRLFFTRLPFVLAIHVQRRFYDPMSNHMSKTAQHVVFPEYLDMAPFCVYGGAMRDDNDAKWAGTASPYASRSHSKMIYRLQALIEHHGGPFSGHYVAYRRDPTTGSWLYISDDTLRRVSWDFVRERQAYMLFYEATPITVNRSE